MLKLTRISESQLLGEGFKRDESFSIDDYLGNAWGLQSYDQDVRVVVHFSPLVAHNVTEVRWHRTQQNREQPDGSVILEFVVSGIQEISWWIAGYGDQAFVIEPMVLRNRLRDMFARLGEMYRGGVDPTRLWQTHIRAGKKAEKRIVERSEFAGKSKPAGQGNVGDADIVVRQDLPVRQSEVFGKPTSGE